MAKKNILTHDPNKLDRLDTFVLAGVVTIFLTRAFLAAAGYPQIGSDSVHVAHVLYGGAVLTAAFLFLLLANKPNMHIAALIGGIGFGLFIDEIGKFVTQDNDYFFQPAIGIMYITFLVIWFLARLIIAKNDGLPLLSPAEWPSRNWQRQLVVFWCSITAMATIAYLPLSVIFGISALTASLGISALGLFTSILYGIFLAFGMWRYSQHNLDAASHDLRGATIFGIVAVFPFYFLNHPAIASFLLIPTILVIIGLSEVSFMSILKKLLPKSI